MSYAGDGLPKLDYARYLAACLAHFVRQQRDRVGMASFDEQIVDYVPPSARHLDVVLHTLDRIEPGTMRRGKLGPPLLRIADRLRRRGLTVLISDLYEEPEAVLDAVRPLRARGQDLIVFHLLDPLELEFPFEEATSFEEMESGERLPVVPQAVRERYRAAVHEHTATLARRLLENRIDYALLNTATPLDYALFTFLSARERLSRVR
jgi:uncharacterized protein (DUF58 family)